MAKIQQLSPHVADLIAAGEVVERPASVVKELTENAIDAGSRHVTVEIQNGGMTFLRLSDDGCGIAAEDAETAFLRHATSKIREAEDLESIHTLGFRGEALAATAAVSRITLLTRTRDAETGTLLEIEGGRVLRKEEAGCPEGTTILVRDLFFNTPARMKFMKRDSVEASAVLAAVQRQALAHPEVAFTYIRDGQEELSTAGDGALATAIYQIYGREFSRELCPVEGKWDAYRLSGFVTKPTATRGNRNYQSFFVNGRYVKSRLLSAALEEAYRNQIMVGRFPGCVLMLTVPEKSVDVNVHPAKTEVKFLNEQEVFDCVRYGVQSALSHTDAKPEVRLRQEKPVEAPRPSSKPAPKQDFFRTMNAEDYRAFAAQLRDGPKAAPAESVTRAILHPEKAEREQTLPVAEQIRIPVPAPKPKPEPVKEPEPFRVIGEAFRSYILVEQGRSVLIVDKHAAHERILFEKFRKQTEPIAAQMLLSPAAARLTPEEAAAVLENRQLLLGCGFEAEDFGDGTVLLRAIPAELDAVQAQETLSELAGNLLDGSRPDPAALREKLLHTVACKAAVKAGWRTDPKELEALVREVLTRDDLRFCPHGRPICITLTEANLEKQFKRT